ncbi:hypothetical protein [Nocardia cyriacigeorgica]|uniref:hypothetical protein n=1 Tax=Nocardia cyriacigeorgica TaxID=135487 RepID=UPI001893A5D0|nr:hypothetical protein [Nocardia cyriacigeorgica]
MGREVLDAWAAVGALMPPRRRHEGRIDGLSPLGRPEFDSNAALAKGMDAVPANWKLPVLAGALLFSLGACCGVGIGQRADRVPPSKNACPTVTASAAVTPAPGCAVRVRQPAVPAETVVAR